MAEIRESETVVRAAGPKPFVTLPFLGGTTVEDIAFYTAVTAVAAFEIVSWPTAALVGSTHALHQRARKLAGTARAELIEATLEVTEKVI